MDSRSEAEVRKAYLRKAICEYEYSPAPEYEKCRMSFQGAEQWTVDVDYRYAKSDVELALGVRFNRIPEVIRRAAPLIFSSIILLTDAPLSDRSSGVFLAVREL